MQNGTTQNRLTDRDILTDLLLTSKQMLGAYGVAEQESTHPQLRQTLHQLAMEEEQFHQQAFQAMHQRGWYETPLADRNLAGQIASLWATKLQQHDAAVRQQAAAPAGSAWGAQPGQQPYGQTAAYYGYGSSQGQPYGQAHSQSSGSGQLFSEPTGSGYTAQSGAGPGGLYGQAASHAQTSQTQSPAQGQSTGAMPNQPMH